MRIWLRNYYQSLSRTTRRDLWETFHSVDWKFLATTAALLAMLGALLHVL